MSLWRTLVWGLLVNLSLAGLAQGEDTRTGRDVLPASSVIFVEVARPAEVIRTLMSHPLVDRVMQLKSYDKAVEKVDFLALRVGVGFVEFQLGMTWKDALTALTEGGMWASFNGPDQGNVLLVKARDEKTLNKIRDTLVKLAKEDAKNKKNPAPFEEETYRERTVYKTKDGGFTTVGPWLVIGDKHDLGKSVIDALIDGKSEGLSTAAEFQKALTTVSPETSLWTYTNIKTIRDAGVAPKLYSGRADDPGGEMLVGGILEALKTADHSITSLTLTDNRLTLEVGLPFAAENMHESREFFFGPRGTGKAPAIPELKDMLFGMSSYRDLSQMWLRAGDLFDEGMNEKLAQADSQLTTFFSGKDFGEDILGAFAPQLHLLATRQAFAETGPVPAIKLPAFAIAFEMKDPEATRREFKRIFQSFIGFLNVVGAMNAQPQLELDIEKDGDLELVTSSYIPEKGEEQSRQAKIQFNFSPTVGFRDRRFVLSSTRNLARDLANAPPTGDSDANTVAKLDADVLSDALNDNLSHLVAQNMLKEGDTREEAEQKLGDLVTALKFFSGASFRLGVADGRMNARFEVDVVPSEAADKSPASTSEAK